MKKWTILTVLVFCGFAIFANGKREDGMTAATGINTPGEYPLITEKTELSYMMCSVANVSDYEDNMLTKALEERTNVKINFILVPEKEYSQKLNLVLASGADLADMLYLDRMSVSSQLMWGMQGVLRPLNDLIEEYGYYVKNAISDYPESQKIFKAADGMLYSFGRYTPSQCYHCSPADRLWINKNWLEKAGLDIPETTEEFKTMLIAFKEQDLNGNNKADEIPLIGASSGWCTDVTVFLLNAFTVWNNTQHARGLYLDDGEVKASYVEEGYRQGLYYLSDLVNEGLLDPVSFTQDSAQQKQLILSEPQVVGSYSNGGTQHYNNDDYFDDYMAIAPLKGPGGVRWANKDNYYGTWSGEAGITTASDKAALATRWLDQFYDPDFWYIYRYGVEDLHWRRTTADDSVILGSAKQELDGIILEDVWATENPHNIHWYLKHPYHELKTFAQTNWDDPEDRLVQSATGSMLLNKYGHTVDMQVPPLCLMPDEIEEFNEIKASVETFVEESKIQFIVGIKDLDEDWDAYIQELNQIGLDRMIEMTQSAYNLVLK